MIIRLALSRRENKNCELSFSVSRAPFREKRQNSFDESHARVTTELFALSQSYTMTRAIPFSSFPETFTVILLWPHSCRSTDSQTVLGVKSSPLYPSSTMMSILLSYKHKLQKLFYSPYNRIVRKKFFCSTILLFSVYILFSFIFFLFLLFYLKYTFYLYNYNDKYVI